MAIASSFPYNKGAVIADILAGCEVYVDIHGTCARKPNGGMLYRARAEVKFAKNGKVELVVPPLTLDESITIDEVILYTGGTGFGSSVPVDVVARGLIIDVNDTLHIKPINITLT